jgi:HK97 gp10 family phage protein
MNVRVTGGKKFEKLLKKIEELQKGVKAGVPKGATTTEGESIPMYAYFNEVGTSRMPARPFLRQCVAENEDKWASTMRKMTYKVIQSGKVNGILVVTGELMKAHIKQTIQKGSFAPDAPSTVKAKARKGKSEPDRPLFDTGQMKDSIDFEVVDLNELT